MAVACACVSPSTKLLGYVVSYLQGKATRINFFLCFIKFSAEAAKYPDDIGELAQQSRANLANTRNSDRERSQAPSLFELDCIFVCNFTLFSYDLVR